MDLDTDPFRTTPLTTGHAARPRHRRVSSAVRRSEWALFDWSAIAFTAPIVLLLTDTDLRVVAANEFAVAQFGCSAKDVIGRRIDDLVVIKAPASEAAASDEAGGYWLNEVLTKRLDVLTVEVSGVRPSGATWVGDMTATHVSAIDAEVDGLAISIADSTAQRRVETALAYSEDRFQQLFVKAPVAMALIDSDCKFVWVNPELCDLLGYTEGEVLGRTTASLTHPRDAETSSRFNTKVFSGVPAKHQLEKRYIRRDGTFVWLDITAVGFADPETGNRVAFGMFVDITDRKRAEEKQLAAAINLQHTLEAAIFAIASAVDVRDPYTAGHQRRVTNLAVKIATEMGLPDDQVTGVKFAAMVHDVGKIGVPAEILSLPRRLDSAEFELVKRHSALGAGILRGIDFPWPIQEIVLQHHERMDGSGYPNNLIGDQILLEARIIAVADVVESMAAHRPYRAALGIEAALEHVELGAGRLYDQTVVDACLRQFRVHGYRLPRSRPLVDSGTND